MKDPEILWKMYVKVVSGIDEALKMMSEKEYKKAEMTLIGALDSAEKLYISSEQLEDELEKWRKR